jgi:acyl dehydratase
MNESTPVHPRGGLYFEDFVVGRLFSHRLTRTVTQMDNMLFSNMTLISVNDTTVGTTIANLGMTDVRFPAPLFEGDTIRATTEVLAARESRSRKDAGLVEFLHRAFKQDDTLVAECRRSAFMRRRPIAALKA